SGIAADMIAAEDPGRDKHVYENHSAFVIGRSIVENAMAAIIEFIALYEIWYMYVDKLVYYKLCDTRCFQPNLHSTFHLFLFLGPRILLC
ncbi:hypothetical protein L195_g044090, partial [Trifolium pratense]